MAGKVRYPPEFIKKCIEMYDRGLSIEQISESCGASVRSVGRWIKVHRNGGHPIDPDHLSLGDDYQKVIEAKMISHAVATDWITNLDSVLDTLGNIHLEVLEGLRVLLDNAIHTTDPSPRAINSLSLSLTRHSEALLKIALSGREREVELHQALAVAESYGYLILDSRKISEIVGVDVSPQPTELSEPPPSS